MTTGIDIGFVSRGFTEWPRRRRRGRWTARPQRRLIEFLQDGLDGEIGLQTLVDGSG